jgi:hypothetical protein
MTLAAAAHLGNGYRSARSIQGRGDGWLFGTHTRAVRVKVEIRELLTVAFATLAITTPSELV